ncbi:MAG: hypothetical protein PHC61_00290 [Chitinivibrionales bacterium]|nr:hypothetical protein [Chitinivibrionales bacterium]
MIYKRTRFYNAVFFGLFLVSMPSAQTLSGIQFWDTTGTKETAKFGWSGDATTGKFFIEAPKGTEVFNIQNKTMTVNGTISATAVLGNGSGLTNVIPADGSTGTAKIIDSAITTAKIKNGAVTDAKIDSVSWGKIKGIPATLTSGTTIDSVRAAKIADSCKRIPDGSVTAAKFSATLKIIADSSRAASFADSCKKSPKNIKVDSARMASRADSLGVLPASRYALKTDLKDNVDSLGGFPSTAYYTKPQSDSAKPIISYYSFTDHTGYYNTLSSGDNTVATISLTAPRAGSVIVSAAAVVFFLSAATDMGVQFLITEKTASAQDELSYTLYGSTTQTAFYSQSRGFAVTPGPHTYRFIITKGANAGDQHACNSVMTLIYVPN